MDNNNQPNQPDEKGFFENVKKFFSPQQAAMPTEESPLDKHNYLTAPTPTTPPPAAPVDQFGDLTPDNLKQYSAGIDFTSGFSPEDKAKFDPEQYSIISKLVNSAAASAFQQATLAANAVAAKRVEASTAGLDSLVSQRLAARQREEKVKASPLLSHPTTRVLQDALVAQITSRDPNISPDELAKRVDGYLTDFSSHATNLANQNSPQARLRREEDSAADFFD